MILTGIIRFLSFSDIENAKPLTLQKTGLIQFNQDFAKEPVTEIQADPLSEWGILSVPNGASKGNQKLEYLDNCAEWLLGMDEIVIATDGDEAGLQLRDEPILS